VLVHGSNLYDGTNRKFTCKLEHILTLSKHMQHRDHIVGCCVEHGTMKSRNKHHLRGL
jgi:hypothetical protein